MKNLLPFLVLFGLTGCAVDGAVPSTEEAETDGPTGEVASAATIITLPPGSITPQPIHPGPFPKLPPPQITFPPPGGTCANTQNRYAIIAAECEAVPGAGGQWTARTVFADSAKAVCEMRWRPDMILSVAVPDLAALEAVAVQERSLDGVSPAPARLRPLCDTSAICNPSVMSCPVRTPTPPPPFILTKGMGGCSSCAYVAGDTVYAVLPSDYTSGVVTVDIGLEWIRIDPAGAQTFTVDVSSIPTSRRTPGFANVYR